MSADERPSLPAPSPARGFYAPGFETLAERFAEQLEIEHGAAVTVFHRGRLVVDLVGGMANVERAEPWRHDTRVVLFSVSKGFAAMALHLLVDRGQLAWDARVADVWPGFSAGGKGSITVGALLSHAAGLPYLDTAVSLEDCTDPGRADVLRAAIERQAPAWAAGTDQGYHSVTFGMYAGELFRQASGEGVGTFARRELFEPLGSDVMLGTPASEDHRMATLYGPPAPLRVAKMLHSTLLQPMSNEARMLRAIVARDSMTRRAFAHPFAQGGAHDGRRYLGEATLAPAYGRVSWSKRDRVLHKPLGWSHGFLKEERHVFSPTPQSFGHAGLGGALGWCDPVHELTFGYVMNRMDWRVRSPRALGLCHALYECEAVREETPSP